MSSRLTDDATVLRTEIEVGMPLTGRNNLAECPLLKLIGDIRWNHIAAITGVRSRDIADEQGARLYATFFYVDIRFPEDRPMATFEENDRITIVSTLAAHENVMLDGYAFLYPEDVEIGPTLPTDGAEAIRMGIPYVRSSNAFVRMVQGASWLKKGTPADPRMNRIPRLTEAPDSYRLLLRVADQGYFAKPPPSYVLLTPGRIATAYHPHPDRDLNGVGLLYFANYPLALDVAERALLSTEALLPLSHDLLDRRTLVRRQLAYLSNIQASDQIDVFLEAWIESPLKNPACAHRPPRLLLNYEMFRRSDGRRMLISTAEKILCGPTLSESGLLAAVEALGS